MTYSEALTLRHGGREFRFLSVVGDARGSTVLYMPNEKILVTGDVVSYSIPYFTPPIGEHAKSLRKLAALDAAVIVPGHGPAWHDKDFLNLEAELFESIVRQVTEAVQQGPRHRGRDQEEPWTSRRCGRSSRDGDPELDARYRRYVGRMIENACREARDGKIWTRN